MQKGIYFHILGEAPLKFIDQRHLPVNIFPYLHFNKNIFPYLHLSKNAGENMK